MIAEITSSTDLNTLLNVLTLLSVLGVFGVLFRAGRHAEKLEHLSSLVNELGCTVAELGKAVAEVGTNDRSHDQHLRDLSKRLQSIEEDLRRGLRAGAHG